MLSFYRHLRPLLFSIDAETAHRAAIGALKAGLVPGCSKEYPSLRTSVFGKTFPNPLGLAAGFDKNAEAVAPLLRAGFGFVEAGTVTPLPQAGNPRPRIFRDVKNRSVINRMGFPGGGMEFFAKNMTDFRARHQGIVGINIGINKDASSPIDDYKKGIECLAHLADYIAINVSSPNTQGLRDLQARDMLDKLLSSLSSPVPLLLKIAPDLEAQARADIAQLALQHRIAGLIISNTTVTRPAGTLDEKGGLSGAPLKNLARETLADFYRLTGGQVPLIGVGGISSAEDAYERICAGASLVQLYTGLVYEGLGLVPRILQGLAELLAKDGFSSVIDAIGTRQESLKDVA